MQSAAVEVATELQPFTVTKRPHFKACSEFAALPPVPAEAKRRLHLRMQNLNIKVLADSTLVIANITSEWLARFLTATVA